MKKVCINDFTPSELKDWLREFYPNGLNRDALEKASNIANINYLLKKSAMIDAIDMDVFTDEEKVKFKSEKDSFLRKARKYEILESDFKIARKWYRQDVLRFEYSDVELSNKLTEAFKDSGFESEILRPEY